MKFLNNINLPRDVKKLNNDELNILSGEIRQALLQRVSDIGGHVGPNLGFVEATIALHYVFNSPIDKIVYDVSHQCYPHKILTGRKYGFINPEKYNEISGYTNPNESEHDMFRVGHTSTSISLACGLAKARDLKGEKENIIAVIGDGSLSGGEAYEGLNNAAVLNSNIIIVVNDNEMSIAVNQGGLYKNLQLLRETNGQAENNIFKALGFEYFYLDEGNNIEKLIETFNKVKDVSKPIVVHIHTEKGKGLEYAEEEKEKWHFKSAFDIETGKLKAKGSSKENYRQLIVNYLSNRIGQDKKLVAITAGTPEAVGFSQEFRDMAGNQFLDVGIAEEHAIAMASGIAKNGGRPVFCVLSSFIQRTYDQLSQDLCLNNNPAVIITIRTGISSGDVTHLGCFDIPMMSNIPNLVYLAPTNKEECIAMLEWSLNQTRYPVAIRTNLDEAIETGIKVEDDFGILNKYKVEEKGKDVAIIGLGNFYWLGSKVKEELKQHGINATLINPRYITGIDEQLLEQLKNDHKLVVTLEDGVLDGGFGEKITRFYGTSDMKVLNYGAKKEFVDRVPVQDLYTKYRLRKDLIVEDILNNIH